MVIISKTSIRDTLSRILQNNIKVLRGKYQWGETGGGEMRGGDACRDDACIGVVDCGEGDGDGVNSRGAFAVL